MKQIVNLNEIRAVDPNKDFPENMLPGLGRLVNVILIDDPHGSPIESFQMFSGAGVTWKQLDYLNVCKWLSFDPGDSPDPSDGGDVVAYAKSEDSVFYYNDICEFSSKCHWGDKIIPDDLNGPNVYIICGHGELE